MKGQISRISHVPVKGYSGLLHRQGGMITDADLNESTAINRVRVEAMSADAVGAGSPAVGGIVWNPAGLKTKGKFTPHLRPGVVYAGGLRGEVKSRKEGKTEGPLDLLATQDDLFDAVTVPKEGQHIVYADLWHRTVHPLEDSRQLEVALNGAETAFRQKTMAQLKTAPIKALDPIRNGGGAFPFRGTGVIAVSALTPQDTGDICDPCATEIPLEAATPNALFRVEVMAITGAANAIKTISLAWSRENASEMAAIGALPEGFADDQHAYEHATWDTEMHKGVFADAGMQRGSTFTDGPLNDTQFDFVRRWDGFCTFTIGGSAGPTIGSGKGGMDDGMPRITADTFAVTLDLAEKKAVVGDYWLIEMRTNAPEDAHLHVVSPTPLGITHHYAPLFRVEDGAPVPLDDAERRALTFPGLIDLPASHVSFDNTCADRFGDAENVQDALAVLCDLDAQGVPFTNPCPDLFGSADTVQEALAALCDKDIGDPADRVWMQHMLDWGVVCGLKVKRVSNAGFTVTPGAFLDWQGQYTTAPWEETADFKIDDLRIIPGALGRDVDPCLGIERLGPDKVGLVVGAPWDFELTGEKTLLERVAACELSQKQPYFDGVLVTLDTEDAKLTQAAIGMAVSGAWRSGSLKLNDNDYARGLAVVEKLEVANKQANPDTAARVTESLGAVDKKYDTNGVVGLAREEQQGKALAEKLNVLIGTSEDFVRSCKCNAIWPDCLDRTAPPRVPLAKLEVRSEGEKIAAITHICMLECRKQALTPRTMAYYLREAVEKIVHDTVRETPKASATLADLADWCCPKPKVDDTRPGDFIPPDYESGRPWGHGSGVIGVREEDPRKNYFDIIEMSENAARDVLTGNGVEVVEVLDLDETSTPGRLAEVIGSGKIDDRLFDREEVAAGGQVMLLMSGGEAAGYVVVEQGKGKYTYTPESERITATARAFDPPLVVGGATGAGDLSADLGDLEGRYQALEGAIAALSGPNGKLQQVQTAYADLDAALAAAATQAGTIEGDLPGKLAAHAETVKGLQADLDSSATTLAEIDTRRGEVQARMQGQLDEMLATGLGDQEDAINALLAQLATGVGEADTTHTALKTAIAATAETLTDLENRTNETARQIEAAQVLVADGDLTAILDRLDGFETRAATLNQTLSAEADTLGALESQVAGLRGQIETVTADIPKLDAQIIDLRSEADTAAAAVTAQGKTLDAEIAERGATLDTQAAQAGTINQMLAANDGTLADLQSRQATLGGLVSELTGELDAAEKTRDAQVEAASATLADLNAQVAAATDEVAALETRKTALTKDVDTLQGELSALDASKTEVIAAIRAERPVTALDGVGVTASRDLAAAGIFTVGDLDKMTVRQGRQLAESAPELHTKVVETIKPAARDFIVKR